MSRWRLFCSGRGFDPLRFSVNHIIEFLTYLVHEGYGYSAVNSARAALSALISVGGVSSVGSHPLIKRFMRGVFNLKPVFPRYSVTWDADIVIEYLCKMQHVEQLSLKQLTLKLVTLTALVSGQRCQTVHLMNLDTMDVTPSNMTFYIRDITKTTAPGKPQPDIVLPVFSKEPNLCIFTLMKHYISRTKDLRTSQKLWISFIKPYSAVSKETISHWIKIIMREAGVNTDVFKPHSTRSASTSAAARRHVPLECIMRAANWRRNSTFHMFYNKPVDLNDVNKFGLAILDGN